MSESSLKQKLIEEKPEFFFKDDKVKLQNLTTVKPEIFDKMKTDQGPTVSDFNQKGYKVVLFFMKSVSCQFCSGTLDDIYALYETLLKLNTVVIICYQESYKDYQNFLNEKPKFAELYSLQQNPFKKYFNLKNMSFFEVVGNMYKTFDGLIKLQSYGVTPSLSQLTSLSYQEQTQLSAIFVVYDKKVISEVHKKNMTDRFDVARIALDPDQFGIQVHTSIFNCERIKKPKIDKKEIIKVKETTLKNINSSKYKRDFTKEDIFSHPVYYKFFKLFATKEWNIENLLFYEAVKEYQQMKEDERKVRVQEILDTFFTEGSDYEININKSAIDKVKNINTPEKDIFNEILSEVIYSSINPCLERFLSSELAIEMQMKDKTIEDSLFIDII